MTKRKVFIVTGKNGAAVVDHDGNSVEEAWHSHLAYAANEVDESLQEEQEGASVTVTVAHKTDDEIRQLGLNPEDYQEVKA